LVIFFQKYLRKLFYQILENKKWMCKVRGDRHRRERIAIYFDCILGILCATFAFIGFIFFAPPLTSENLPAFLLNLSFWLFLLAVSFFLIGLGIHTYYKEKNYDPNAPPREDIKAPMVS
jgi:hypothetical protein